MLTHISLFTGIAGIDLATEWAGFETVLMVENNDYCQKVLKKHWPDVPIIGEIKDVTKEKVMAYTKSYREGRRQSEDRAWEGIKQRSESAEGSTESNRYVPITLITGGFPCQPISQAGQRRGKEDDRYLWPEMLRVIKEVRPVWVVAENVAGLITMGLDDCLSDLEREGYITETFLIPACAVNAPHRRDRIFIVAHTKQSGAWGECGEAGDQRGGASQERGEGLRQGDRSPCPSGVASAGIISDSDRAGSGTPRGGTDRNKQEKNKGWEEQPQPESGGQGEDVVDTNTERLQGHRGLRECGGEWLTWQGNTTFKGIWESEPELGRVAYGIPSRVDRLKCLGNAVVPQQIYPILKAIADIESDIEL